LTDIIKNVKSSRKRWDDHLAITEDDRNIYRVFVENPEGRRPLREPRLGRRVIKVQIAIGF
jgi:hypothetical protein